MRIAVIIPVYNVTSFFEEALSSATAQDCPDLEIIVVDDGSAPAPAVEIDRICARYPQVRLLRQENKGAAAARDFGVAHSTAEGIIFLDADDVLTEGAVAYLAEALQEKPDAVAVYARVVNIDEKGTVISKILPAESRLVSGRKVLEYMLERKIVCCNGSILVRRQTLLGLAAIAHHLVIGEDTVLWCHLALVGEIMHAGNRVVLHRRKHSKNISATALEHPDMIFAAYDTIFSNSLFSNALGAERLEALQEKCMCRTYAYLASLYAVQGNVEEAMQFLQKISLPLSAIHDGEVEEF